jgi:hypothetical protein
LDGPVWAWLGEGRLGRVAWFGLGKGWVRGGGLVGLDALPGRGGGGWCVVVLG